MKRTPPKVIVDANGKEHHFPPKLNLDYSIRNGRVQTRSLEAHIVDHCNLTCAECCSLSPLLPKWWATPKELARDLQIATRYLEPRTFKLVGGEPLLHPKISEMARVARDSGIAPRISLTTNGVLLDRTDDALWEALDAMTVSLYPSPALSAETIERATQRAAHFGVEMNWKRQEQFVIMDKGERCTDEATTEDIYKRCWLRERCHTIRNGLFYTCTRPPHMRTLFDENESFSHDGYSLVDGASARGLVAYLTREQPLEACAYCHGGDAEMAPHRMRPRAELRQIRKRKAG